MNDSIIFRLNNSVFQVFLKDKTQLIFSIDKRSIIYKNILGEKQYFPLTISQNFCDNNDIMKKIFFGKELLASIYKDNLKMITIKQKENNHIESNI